MKLILLVILPLTLVQGERDAKKNWTLKGLCQLGGMRNRVPALTEQFEIVVPTFSNTVGEVRKPFPSA